MPAVRVVQQRIQKLHTHLLGVPHDALITPALLEPLRHSPRLRELGLLRPGAPPRPAVLPPAVGPRTRFNATGDEPSSGRRRRADPAPEVRLRVAGRPEAPWAILAEGQLRGVDDDRLVHSVNIFLELFGECDVLWEPTGAPGPVGRTAAV